MLKVCPTGRTFSSQKGLKYIVGLFRLGNSERGGPNDLGEVVWEWLFLYTPEKRFFFISMDISLPSESLVCGLTMGTGSGDERVEAMILAGNAKPMKTPQGCLSYR